MNEQPDILRKAVLQQLESWQQAGVQQLSKSRGTRTTPGKPAAKSKKPPAASTLAPPATQATEVKPAARGNSGAIADVVNELEVIRAEVAACTACAELASTRTQTVFGVGNPQARLCFLGEAPGADEDKQGEPFVGRAGQLLNKIIEACTLKREEVYILNVLKCRPPGNRNPLPSEAAACQGFLHRQLDLIQPEFLCCLGTIAAQTLLATDTSIGKLRGKFFDYRGIKVVCTYHPAYLLRNPDAKRFVWDDMKLLMKEMGSELN
jgi:DNA polymerase